MEDQPRSVSDTQLSRTRIGGQNAYMHHWLRGVSRLPTPMTSIRSIDNLSTNDIERAPHSRREVKDRMRRYSIARDDAEVERRVMFASRPSMAATSRDDTTDVPDDGLHDHEHEHEHDHEHDDSSSYQPDDPPLTPGTSVSRVELEIMAEGAPKIVLEAPEQENFLDVLDETFRRGSVLLDLKKRSWLGITHSMVKDLEDRTLLSKEDVVFASSGLIEQEALFRQAFPNSFNMTFITIPGIETCLISFARLHREVNFSAPDGSRTKFFFLVVYPEDNDPECFLNFGRTLTDIMADSTFASCLWTARNRDDLKLGLFRYQERLKKIEIGKEEGEDGLRWTRRFAGGFMEDFRRRWKHYGSDWKDGKDWQAFSAAIIIFVGILTQTVAFGGLLDIGTDSKIGVIEALTGVAMCSVVFSIFGGQYFIILGPTGPLVVFANVLFQWTETLGINYLTAYAWVGIWMGVILIVLALVDASSLIQYVTRFMDEIFAALIAVIFVYEAFKDLFKLYQHEENDVAFFGSLLLFGTFLLASWMGGMKNSPYLLHFARDMLSNYGTFLSVIIMTVLSHLLAGGTKVEHVKVPSSFGTSTGRGWMADLGDIEISYIFIAIIPAILLSILMYLEMNIIGRIVNRPEKKLQKGPSYHYDLFILGILSCVTSIFGLPWVVAAAVPTLQHVNALSVLEDSEITGTIKTTILSVRETRVPLLLCGILLSLSLVVVSILSLVPMSVLFGIFLLMGVVSLQGNQFFDRIKLLLRDPAYYPENHIVRNVPVATIHKFTMIQLICLIILWVVKLSPIAILFPLFLIALIPLRVAVTKYISKEFMELLDWEEEEPPSID